MAKVIKVGKLNIFDFCERLIRILLPKSLQMTVLSFSFHKVIKHNFMHSFWVCRSIFFQYFKTFSNAYFPTTLKILKEYFLTPVFTHKYNSHLSILWTFDRQQKGSLASNNKDKVLRNRIRISEILPLLRNWLIEVQQIS